MGRSPGKDDELDPQKGHQDQGGPHRLQVYVRVLLRFLYFLHKHPDEKGAASGVVGELARARLALDERGHREVGSDEWKPRST